MSVNSLFCRFPSVLISYARKSTINLHHSTFPCARLSYFTNTSLTKEFSKMPLAYPLNLSSRNMAGHSKWQNIQHIKAEKDRKKNLMCNKYVRMVTAAIREKGPDPKLNNKLANLLEEAKKNNVPGSTLENALKRANNKKIKPGTVEILGPGGCFVIVDYETDNVCDIRHTLKIICKKYSFNILPGEGRWRAVYEQKGIIKIISQLNGDIIDGENILDVAIEAGAEDVQKRDDENDTTYYEFLSDPKDFHAVKKELEKNYIVEEAYIGYLPMSKVSLSDEEMVLADKFLDELENLPDVSRMFENIE